MRSVWLLICVALGLSACTRKHNSTDFEHRPRSPVAQELELPLISRDVLFGHAERMRVRLSQDGKWVAFVAPIKSSRSGPEVQEQVDEPQHKTRQDLGLYRAPVADPENVELVLKEGTPSFPEYYWTSDSNKIMFLRDIEGNENSQLHVIDIASGEVQNMTSNPKAKVRYHGESPFAPGQILFSQNDRDPRLFDLYVYDLKSGETRLLYLNTEEFLEFLVDDKLEPRVAYKYDADGNMDWFENHGGQWEVFKKVPFEDTTTTQVVGADWKKDTLYIVDSSGRDKAALKALNLRTKKESLLAENDKADITDILTNFDGSEILASSFTYLKQDFIPANPEFAEELRRIRALYPGQEIKVDSRSRDDKTWMVTFVDDNSSIRYVIWNRETRKATPSYVLQKALDELRLAEMNPVEIRARDGLILPSYLTFPADVLYDPQTLHPKKPVPMVLYVHGGPWSRDNWMYDPVHQWLSNRGYAVLSVNYRGSTGFGKNFVAASYGEWGRKMHDDLIDAVNWAVDNGIAPKDKIAIMGASYGGYATLVGLSFTPEVFAAGVDIVGVANLVTMQETIPDYWKPFKTASVRRLGGDVSTPEGREFLLSRSPLKFAHQIRRPLLIGHGDNDPRVKLSEAQQITDRMVELGLPVTLMRFADEGHGIGRPENRSSFYGAVEVFLQKHLGGRAEPLRLVPGTTMNVPVGAEYIPGLPEALKGSPKP